VSEDAKATAGGSARPLDLDPPPEAMLSLLHEVCRRTVSFLASLPAQPSHSTEDRDSAASWVREACPEEGAPLHGLLEPLFGRIIPCSLNTAGPGYLAYVPGGGLYSAAVAEFLAAAVNRYAGVWAAAPGAVELETEVLRWLCEWMGFRPEAGALGVLTTGASLSALIAVVAAREKLLGDDIGRGTLYVSEEVHHTLPKAARVAGIRPENCRTVPVDDRFRLRVEALEAMVRDDRRRGLRPFFVCGSAGTVNTGAVDPLADIARLAQREDLWFHADGAYGALFRLVDDLRPLFAGIEEADSVALDPHKGLFLAYGTGALLVRKIEDLHRAFKTTAAYLPQMQEGSERVDFCDLSPELSRDWRGLRIWLPLKLHGLGAFRRALAEKRTLALEAYERLRREPDVEIAAPPELSLFAFRQRFPGAPRDEENRRNRSLLEQVNSARRVYLTGTEVRGKFYLRVCILHLRTHQDRVEEALETVLACLRAGREEPSATG
jgi:aromatic-L-amino-acid decarboxylase